MKSDSYKPADCCCLCENDDNEPCWGEVGLDIDNNICCEGHMGFDYIPEPSAEVANLKVEVARLRNERDNAFKQRDAFAGQYHQMKNIADAKFRETQILRHERDALIDAQVITHAQRPELKYLLNTGLIGSGPMSREDAVRRIRNEAGLPETEPTT